MREYKRQWIAARRKQWFDANGPCKFCGSSTRLELDHIEPSTKITHKVWSFAKVRRENELAKCQVLCHSCHKKKTIAATRTGQQTHGTTTGYFKWRCRCMECKTFYSSWRKARYQRTGI